MDISLFLARLFGIYFIVAGFSILANRRMLAEKMGYFKEGTMYIFGAFTFIMGIALTLAHNVWQGGWRVVVTLICWLTLLKGALLFLFPSFFFTGFAGLFWKKILRSPATTAVLSLSIIALGACLAYIGFLA